MMYKSQVSIQYINTKSQGFSHRRCVVVHEWIVESAKEYTTQEHTIARRTAFAKHDRHGSTTRPFSTSITSMMYMHAGIMEKYIATIF